MSRNFKTLTFIFFLYALSCEIFADIPVLGQEKFKTHLRWNIFSSKEDIYVTKKGSTVFIRTLNNDLFNRLKSDVDQISKEKNYIEDVKSFSAEKNLEEKAATLEIKLVSENIELFSFYRDREKKYVVDFWLDTEELNPKISSLEKSNPDKEVAPTEEVSPPREVAQKNIEAPKLTRVPPAVIVKKAEVKIEIKAKEEPSKSDKLTLVSPTKLPALPILTESKDKKKEEKNLFSRNKGVRDFRYGAAFIFSYNPISPLPPSILDLENKTAEEFYPITNRNFSKDNKEAHLQLTINFYRQKKWGLMSKSIKLFEEKYGEAEVRDLHDYLKANSFLRENIVKKEETPTKMAIGLYKDIADRTKEYELARGINKYLLQHYIATKQYIDALQTAKKLYTITKEKFDMEDARDAVEYMFYSLAQLDQVDKIRDLASDKSIEKLLTPQLRLAYEFFAMSSLHKDEELVKKFENIKKSLGKNVEPSILFNAAESYFRLARYNKSLEIFDEFITRNSHMTASSFARVRIALIYDLLDKDYDELVKLYKNAINLSQNEEASFEAKIRYVALRSIRKMSPNKEDMETRVFLEKEDLNKTIFNPEILKLLWLTRLRTFIVDKDHSSALTYLAALPLDKMSAPDLKVFDGDGAEIIYGMIIYQHKKSDYAKLVKLWEVYKDRFLSKVAVDPYMNFIVGHAYLKLGLTKGFARLIENFEKLQGTPEKTFPNWNDVESPHYTKALIAELKVIKEMNEKNWAGVTKTLEDLQKINPELNKIHYYKGLSAYAQKDYKLALWELEGYFAGQNEKEIYDSVEVAEMLRAYTDSLYENNELDKFAKVADALLQDIGTYGEDNSYMNKVKERIAYLTIEILGGKNTPETLSKFENSVRDFEKNYKDSIYSSRVKYLLGVALISNRKVEEGKKVFQSLLETQGTQEYIKELVRSELSTLKIKERTL